LKRFFRKQEHTKGVKDFISVLMLYQDYPAGTIGSAADKALSAHITTSQAVEHIVKQSQDHDDGSCASLTQWRTLPPPDVTQYDRIGGAL
jgi:hypothetical protein